MNGQTLKEKINSNSLLIFVFCVQIKLCKFFKTHNKNEFQNFSGTAAFFKDSY